MAKLYWRIKKNGKWTWKPAEIRPWLKDDCITVLKMEEE